MTPALVDLPPAPAAIAKGSSLAELLGEAAIVSLAARLSHVCAEFDGAGFVRQARDGLESLGLMRRGQHLARVLRGFLPSRFEEAVEVILRSLTPPLERTERFGLGVFFYLPHTLFVAAYGLEPGHNGGRDPFPAAMRAQYELTRRFTAEFSIRPFLLHQPERTLSQLLTWTTEACPHVRRLCSEGSRPRLPWGIRLPVCKANPCPALPILEKLKDDPSLYVRRSVANHLGDVAKEDLSFVLDLCAAWLRDAPAERRWVIRHALRYPAKKGEVAARELRARAGGEEI